jgi:biopolymer transport protein ExbD
VIHADAGTVYQRLITVMDLLRQGGVTNYAFAAPR